MTHDSQVEALPCPFCGGSPAFDSTDERTRLHCSGCGTEGGLFFFSQEECESGIGDATEARAIAAWNRRTTLSALAAGKVEAIPEGFRILPIEATDAMTYADWDVTMSDAHSNGGVSAAAWQAMVEAAPQVTYGNGHSGVGWYMHDTDYPEEGAVFLGPECTVAASPSPLSADPESAVVGARQHGFTRDDLECIAEGLEKGYERTVNVGNTTGEGDEHLESTTAAAARFIRAALGVALGDTPLQNGQTMAELAAVEREHFGDPDKGTGIYADGVKTCGRADCARAGRCLAEVRGDTPDTAESVCPHGVPASQAPSSDRATCPAHGGDYHWTQDCPECVKDARERGMSIDAYYSRVRPTLRPHGVSVPIPHTFAPPDADTDDSMEGGKNG